MKTLKSAMRLVEKKRKNPGQEKPLSSKAMAALSLISIGDRLIDYFERYNLLGYLK